ncbi:MAG TPA: TIR domain-containing protein [Chloroflexota bacterium]|nr:TIR domain-containing protein [Chloroflexota bacterium]
MSHASLHQSLKTEEVATGAVDGLNVKLVRLQDGKEDIRFSLHAYVSTWISAGFQLGDFLELAGFEKGRCAFFPGGECYARQVSGDFNLGAFTDAGGRAYQELRGAETHLQRCGIFLDRPSARTRRGYAGARGDGHTSPKQTSMKQAEDDNFQFAFTWLEGGQDKGWATHYRPKQDPSAELMAAFNYLDFNQFGQCPEFDFDPCYWHFVSFEGGRNHFESNAGFAHQSFDAHAEHFSPALEQLLEVHRLLRPFGMSFLRMAEVPLPRPAPASPARPAVATAPRLTPAVIAALMDQQFDVAVSFAGPQRDLAQAFSDRVKAVGLEVFYDNYYPAQLWGTDLPVVLDTIYRKNSKYCAIFISGEYNKRMWTNHERKSAQARALEERGNTYILPIKVEDVELPGLAPTIGYVSLKDYTIEQIADLFIERVKG